MKQPGHLSTAPSVRLPLQFVICGVISLFSGVGLLLAYPEVMAAYH